LFHRKFKPKIDLWIFASKKKLASYATGVLVHKLHRPQQQNSKEAN
jgi:hypothetical protein